MAELLHSITGWVAEFESKGRSERVKAGQARALKEGKRLGCPAGSKDRQPRGQPAITCAMPVRD